MKILIAGWFSFEQGHATAGDLLARDIACEWLEHACYCYDIAVAPPFHDGIDWRIVDPKSYSHVLFVCGPFGDGKLELAFLERFSSCRLFGLNLSMLLSIDIFNPFDFLIERDSSRDANPDIVFLSRQPLVPVVGVCLVEPYKGALDNVANEAIRRFTASREMSIVEIDTRLDSNSTGLRSPAEIESIIARMDVVITTRLHGMVLALKNGVPVIAIDPEAGGAKICRQAQTVGWPIVFAVDSLTDEKLQEAFDYCLTEDARIKATECREKAIEKVAEIRDKFISALNHSREWESKYLARTNELISVVITCYNHANFLGEAIESVLAQSYKNFEIIVVDDGSSDNTAEIAAGYPDVRYIRQENQGLAAARNTGLHSSRGKYIVFLDADDKLLPNALQAGLNCFHVHPKCAFVSGHYRYIKANGSLLNEYPQRRVEKDHYLAMLRGNYIGMHATVMYRRNILESAGGFNASLPACEDYDLYLRIARKFPIYSHSEVIAEYRRHGTNMSCNAELMLKTVLDVLGSQWEYVKSEEQYKKAFNLGIRGWKEHYGNELLTQIKNKWTRGERKQAVREMIVLLLYAPRYLLKYAYRKAKQIVYRTFKMATSILSHLPARWRYQADYPSVGNVRFGSLRCLTPIGQGFEGIQTPTIDRYYIENFFARQANDIRGHLLEIENIAYTYKFGGERVIKRELLHVTNGNSKSAAANDLSCADHIHSNTFNCIIFPQGLYTIYDIKSAVHTLHRILKPGGVLLATVPGTVQFRKNEGADLGYWGFTITSARRLFEEVFTAENVTIESYGNILAATAFLHRLTPERLRRKELDYHDSHYPVLITIRAVKAEQIS